MAITKISNQFYYNGSKKLDAKTQPVNTISELSSIPVKDRYEGMAVIVLNDVFDEEEEIVSTCPIECWLVGGTANRYWKVKHFSSVPTYSALSEYTITFKKMIAVGTEATVIEDETNEGKLTKYWVTKNDGTEIIWEKMIKGDGDYVPKDCISGSDVEKS